jgi:hypothetical protein
MRLGHLASSSAPCTSGSVTVPVVLTGWWLAGGNAQNANGSLDIAQRRGLSFGPIGLSQLLTWIILLTPDDQASVSFTNPRGTVSVIFDRLH